MEKVRPIKRKKSIIIIAGIPICVIPNPLQPNPTNHTKTVAAPKGHDLVDFFLQVKTRKIIAIIIRAISSAKRKGLKKPQIAWISKSIKAKTNISIDKIIKRFGLLVIDVCWGNEGGTTGFA